VLRSLRITDSVITAMAPGASQAGKQALNGSQRNPRETGLQSFASTQARPRAASAPGGPPGPLAQAGRPPWYARFAAAVGVRIRKRAKGLLSAMRP